MSHPLYFCTTHRYNHCITRNVLYLRLRISINSSAFNIFRPFTLLSPLFRARKDPRDIYTRYIYYIVYITFRSRAFSAAVRCYTIIWLNQSLPLIRSGISGGNYWNWLFELEIFGVTLRSAEGFIEFCLVIL